MGVQKQREERVGGGLQNHGWSRSVGDTQDGVWGRWGHSSNRWALTLFHEARMLKGCTLSARVDQGKEQNLKSRFFPGTRSPKSGKAPKNS